MPQGFLQTLKIWKSDRDYMAPDRVGDLANQAFVSLDENALVAEAAKALYEREECSVIVTGNDNASQARIPVGIITERDIISESLRKTAGRSR